MKCPRWSDLSQRFLANAPYNDIMILTGKSLGNKVYMTIQRLLPTFLYVMIKNTPIIQSIITDLNRGPSTVIIISSVHINSKII